MKGRHTMAKIHVEKTIKQRGQKSKKKKKMLLGGGANSKNVQQATSVEA